MAKITTPVEGFTGTVVGVTFADGKGETDNESAIAYFRRHGYGVEVPQTEAAKPVEVPEGEPSAGWTVDQLKAYAKQHDVDLGKASKKDDIVAALTAAASKSAGDAPAQ